MIRLKGVNVKKGNFSLRDIDLEVESGDYFAVVGPTGCGKTLLLETIAGVNRVTAGEVCHNGNDITYNSIRDRDISMVYQNLYLFPNMSVKNNILFPLKSMKIGRGEMKSRFKDTVELFGIGDIMDRSVRNLSGGEKQRVALARTLILGRKLLLLDEPFSALDTVTKWEILKHMKYLYEKNGLTVIHVTHDIEEALFLSKHLGIMSEGEIIQTGSTKEVYENPMDVRCARLVKKENMFVMRYGVDGLLSNGSISFYREGLRAGSEYLVHIPPEDIIISRKRLASSARNVFEATVKSVNITSYGVAVNLCIKNNHMLTSFITRRSALDMGLIEGDRVFLIFKSTSVEAT